MSNRLLIFLAAMCAAGLLALLLPTDQPRVAIDTSPERVMQGLADLHDQAEGARARRLALEIQRVRGKTTSSPENPGELLDAFAQIRTAPDGTTYTPNYTVRERRRAQLRKTTASDVLPWVQIGPGNVSGRSRGIVVDRANGDAYFATIGGGIWKFSDADVSFELVSPEMTSLSTTSIVQAPSNRDVMYVGTGMGYGRVVELAGTGIWKTTDRGQSWFQLESTAGGAILGAVNRLVVDPQDENIVLACTNDSFSHLGPKGGTRRSGIFRTIDGGVSWTQVFDSDAFFGPATDNRVQQILADPTNFDRLYATVNEVGVIRSLDAGLTWQVSANDFALPSDIGNPTNNGFGLAGVSVRTEMAIAPSDPMRLYAAVERPRGISDLYMSRDGGDSWQLLPDSGNDPNWFNSFGTSGSVQGAYTAGWFDNTIAVHPFDENVVFVGGVNIYRIDVNPNARTRLATPLTYWTANTFGLPWVHADHHFLVCVPADDGSQNFSILDANDGGLGFSPDGGSTWSHLTGMNTTQFYGADKKPGENVYFGGAQDNGTWVSGPNPGVNSTWNSVIGGDGFEVAWNQADPNLLIGASQNGGFARSTDSGQTWQSFRLAGLGAQPFITKIASNSLDPDLVFAVGQNGVARSNDFGRTWTLTPINGNWLGYRPFDNVEISEASPQVVWASSRLSVDPPSGLRGGVHVSDDGGLTFRDVSSNFPSTVDEASGIASHPSDPNTAYLLFSAPASPKVLVTHDLGETWTDLSGFSGGGQISSNGFPDVAVFSLIQMPHDHDALWVGTEIGLFISQDGGDSWEYADNGLPHVSIFQLRIVEDQVLVSTQGLGIWTVTLPELADAPKPEVVLSPRVLKFAMHPSGKMLLEVDQRSSYERTQVFVNGQLLADLPPNNQPKRSQVWLPVAQDGTWSCSISAHDGGRLYKSGQVSAQVFVAEPSLSFASDFNQDADSGDFISQGMQRAVPQGFTDGAMHSPHAYATATDYVVFLKTPIQVQQGATTVRYRDIALVEPGTGNGVFGNPQFWDYVVCEATSDGIDWVPLGDGYDARADSAWLQAYNNGAAGGQSLYRQQEYDLNGVFHPGEFVFVRFRLNSDAAVTGWGWAIDDIDIAGSGVLPDSASHLVYPGVCNNDQFDSILVINNPGSGAAYATLTGRRDQGEAFRAERLVPGNGFIAESIQDLFPDLDAGTGLSVELESALPGLHGNWVTNNLFAASGRSPSQGVAIALGGPSADTQSFGERLLFGYLPMADGLTSAPVIVNLGGAPADVVLEFVDSQGEVVLRDETRLNGLEPMRPFAAVANQLVDPSVGQVSLIASSDQPLTGVAFVFNDGAEPSIGNATSIGEEQVRQLVYPWISKNDQFESILVANNLSDAEIVVQLTARRRDGDAETVSRMIAPGGFLAESAGSLFPATGDGSGYAVVAESDGSIAGRWVTNNLDAASGRSPSQGVAIPIPESGQSRQVGNRLLYHFLPVQSGLTSAPVLVALDGEDANVSLTFIGPDGRVLLKDEQTLAGLEPLRPFAAVANQLVPGSGTDVMLIAESAQSRILGVTFVFNDGAEPAIGNAIVP